MKRILILAMLLCTVGCNRSDMVRISNGKVSLGFERQTGRLLSFRVADGAREMIDSSAVDGLPWALLLTDKKNDIKNLPYTVTFKKRGRDRVHIIWNYTGGAPFEVAVDVSLEKGRPMSHWRSSFKGLSGHESARVSCPVISGIRAYDNADLIVPANRGHLVHDPGLKATETKPVSYSQGFPGGTVQLMALYDRENQKNGLYFSSQDTGSFTKSLSCSLTPGHVGLTASTLIPDKEKTDAFAPGYDIVVGVFDGNWFDAARIYREWAVGEKFCRESRFHSGLSPKWLQETAFWVWNRGRSDNVLAEAEDLQERLGLPVSVHWHWWHGCPYDDGFPEYVPPKEGRESFIKAMDHAREKGIRSIVYMNSFQWGDATESWENRGAAAYAARSKDGGTYRHVFNIFSGNGLTPMCLSTPFWRDTYSALCDTVVNRYHAGGVYMDQSCNNFLCYNPDHGHPLGGGNAWVDGFGKLTAQIRDCFAEGTDVMLAGEGTAEDWIPLLDDFLALVPSWERTGGVNNREPIPLFQAIFHDYAMTYGSYSSLVYPPYDELWPKQFRPKNAETLLPEEFNLQFRMEQARAFTWGMQPTLANYHSFLFDERKTEMEFLVDLVKTRYNALDYLLYGTMKDLPVLPSQEVTMPISRISIYAGRTGNTVTRFEMKAGTLYACLWQSQEGNLALAVSNIADEDQEVSFTVDAGRFGLPAKGSVNLITAAGKQALGTYSDKGEVRYTLPARSNCLLELTK